ncbi:MAG: T9SS type A sorting domain-containing protein [Bacteroidetes bacterium]|nr:T9SS type A sorting domain-containing protein [Bacteroidota bacterium]
MPNPTNDVINIKSAFSQSWATVEIINMYGNKVIAQSFTDKLDISALDNGIYSIVLIDANGNKFKQKLLKNSK